MSEKYNLTWIDHHKSSMDLLKKHPELDNIKGIRNEEASGAFLTYMYLWDVHSLDEIPYYVKLVSDYDIFTFNYGEQTTYFYLGTNTEDNNSCFSKLWSDLFYYNTKPLELIEKGRVIKKYVDHDNARYLNSYGFEAKIGVYKCYVVNRISNSWIFGEKYEEYPVVCVYAYDGERYKYTLYSNANSGIDCEAIAKSFGGGGHKHAAGFSLNYNLFDEQTHLDLK